MGEEDDGELEEYMYDVNIARRVEIEKLNQIQAASIALQAQLGRTGRCKICTLRPPCRHIPDPFQHALQHDDHSQLQPLSPPQLPSSHSMNRSFYRGLNQRSTHGTVSPVEAIAHVNIAGP